jgi:dolichyl-phosphate beta-glucosyltransferase
MVDSHRCQRPRVALVIPCYNEALRLNVPAFVESQSDACELRFVLVDDGSQDRTRAVLEEIRAQRPDTIVVAYDDNAGKAEAVRRGLIRALETPVDFVGYWDADLATPLDEVPRFVDVLQRRPLVGCVIGARVQLLGRHIHRHPWRHYLGRVFAMAASITLDLPVYDTQCGAKLLRGSRELAGAVSAPFLTSWIFDVELIARLRDASRSSGVEWNEFFYELPLRRWSDVKGSKLRARDLFRVAFDLRRIWRRYR